MGLHAAKNDPTQGSLAMKTSTIIAAIYVFAFFFTLTVVKGASLPAAAAAAAAAPDQVSSASRLSVDLCLLKNWPCFGVDQPCCGSRTCSCPKKLFGSCIVPKVGWVCR